MFESCLSVSLVKILNFSASVSSSLKGHNSSFQGLLVTHLTAISLRVDRHWVNTGKVVNKRSNLYLSWDITGECLLASHLTQCLAYSQCSNDQYE